jgi:hypothetical protein
MFDDFLNNLKPLHQPSILSEFQFKITELDPKTLIFEKNMLVNPLQATKQAEQLLEVQLIEVLMLVFIDNVLDLFQSKQMQRITTCHYAINKFGRRHYQTLKHLKGTDLHINHKVSVLL